MILLKVIDLHAKYGYASTSGWSETIMEEVSEGSTMQTDANMGPGDEFVIMQVCPS